jgi:hypothetical protein
MIYFDGPTQRQVLEQMHGVLRPAACCLWAIPRTSPTRATSSACAARHLRARLSRAPQPIPSVQHSSLKFAARPPNPRHHVHRATAPRATGPPPGPGGSHGAPGALKSLPRKPGEASFFFYDAHFKSEAVKVLPGEYFVYDEDLLIMTTLGSCIAACLWDRDKRKCRRHEPLHAARRRRASDSGRYGSFAMELLINELMKRGATR